MTLIYDNKSVFAKIVLQFQLEFDMSQNCFRTLFFILLKRNDQNLS